VPDVAPDHEHFHWSSLVLIPSAVLVLFIGPLAYALYLGFTNMERIGPCFADQLGDAGVEVVPR